ncbi:hypothetical protein [Burkholderia guangdongensis]|uniref:hypothetical protein n=1 Tax=Burkholderia guangdongensis TaxID=1792500 RepID=UPI0015CB91A8|nr:hypothetical protein [Burkholderia guangdongensis]
MEIAVEPKARALELDGQKVFVRLDAPTWQAIEMLAMANGCDWGDWIRDAWEGVKAAVGIEQATSVNRAAAFRMIATMGLMNVIKNKAAMEQLYRDEHDETPEPMRRIEIEVSDGVFMKFTREQARVMMDKLRQALTFGTESEQ